MSVQQKTILVNGSPVTPVSNAEKEAALQELKHGNRSPQAKKYLSGLTNKQKVALLAAGIGIPALAAIAYGISHSAVSGTEGTPDPQPIGGDAITPVNDPVAASETDITADVVRYNFSPKVSTSVNDTMSFGEAFMTARNELGMGNVFLWKGQAYNTFYKEEFNQLTEAEKEAFFDAYEKLNIKFPEDVVPTVETPIEIVNPDNPEDITEIKTNPETGEIELTPKQVEIFSGREIHVANMSDEEKIKLMTGEGGASSSSETTATETDLTGANGTPESTTSGTDVTGEGPDNANDGAGSSGEPNYGGESSSSDASGMNDI